VITVEEQLSGWYTLLRRTSQRDVAKLARTYQRLTDNVEVLTSLRILSFTDSAIRKYCNLRDLKLNMRKMDLRIAAITLDQCGTLVTRNLADFRRVPGLAIEDWTQ
jgi:tRNA(fMet)-specific endonuclease VapC